ncbi:hypothetical protein AJ87_15840 [Rhizobium yanglingense]|nr:hypothetical protein AJ87_15840 [Rhizobium yanglingense]
MRRDQSGLDQAIQYRNESLFGQTGKMRKQPDVEHSADDSRHLRDHLAVPQLVEAREQERLQRHRYARRRIRSFLQYAGSMAVGDRAAQFFDVERHSFGPGENEIVGVIGHSAALCQHAAKRLGFETGQPL